MLGNCEASDSMTPKVENPKLFISYSWTTAPHEEWVIKLAEDLVASGVDVILDKWHLREGHDAHAFMEQMVSDPSIGKVAMICDRAYVAKADVRRGGVGTETQIITPQIFAHNQQKQDKYVAIVREHDEQGSPCRPVYFGSRIFIDFTDDQDYARSFEQLMRWIYDKPVHVRPPLGKRPAYLEESSGIVQLSIAPAQARVIDALRNGRGHAIPAMREFYDLVVSEFDKLDIDLGADPFDEAVIKIAEGFKPYRDAIVDVFIAAANYSEGKEWWEATHRFFEKLIPFLDVRRPSSSFREWDFDHYRIIVQELFLYLVAVCLKYERFQALKYLVESPYYAGSNLRGNEPMRMFTAFQDRTASLAARNERLHEGRRTSPLGDLYKQQSAGSTVRFDDLMAADFVLYFLSRTLETDSWTYWWPNTLVYLDRYGHGLETFIRCRSKAFFERFRLVLSVKDKSDLLAKVAEMERDPQDLPRWSHTRLTVDSVMKLEAIATLP